MRKQPQPGMSMFSTMTDLDRTIAKIVGWTALVLLVGLTVTGVWQFLHHEPDTSWSRYVLGSNNFPNSKNSDGIAFVHGALGDFSAMLAFAAAAWLTARVLFRISWSGVGALLVCGVSLITGSLIRFNATVRDGVLDTETAGYTQLFGGEVDLVITDSYELSVAAVIIWTILHVVSVPVLVVGAWWTVRRAAANRARRRASEPRWLEGLASRR